MYEAPHRLAETLKELYETLGDRRLTLCRELTKRHEESWETTLSGALKRYETESPRGECVLVLEGKTREEVQEDERRVWENMSIQEHVDFYIGQGMDKKEAMKAAAGDRGVSKREIYKELLNS